MRKKIYKILSIYLYFFAMCSTFCLATGGSENLYKKFYPKLEEDLFVYIYEGNSEKVRETIAKARHLQKKNNIKDLVYDLLNKKDNNGFTPLVNAVNEKNDVSTFKIVNILLNQKETNVNLGSTEFGNPLYLAFHYKNLRIFKLLLSHLNSRDKIDVNMFKNSPNPMPDGFYGTAVSFLDVVYSTEFNEKTNRNFQYTAALLSHPKTDVTFICDKQNDLAFPFFFGVLDDTPLSIMKKVLNHPTLTDINIADSKGNTAAYYALYESEEKLLEILNHKTFDIKRKHGSKHSLFYLALHNKMPQAAVKLCTLGDDINFEYRNNGVLVTPYTLSLYRSYYNEKYLEVLEAMEKRGYIPSYEEKKYEINFKEWRLNQKQIHPFNLERKVGLR